MSDDAELLGLYVRERSEGAFTELVQRHLNLVYGAAMREMAGDSALAEDVAQAVFVELARKAERLVGHPALAGWLYTSVRHVGANCRRAEARRRRREEEVMDEQPDSPEAAWTQMRPLIDDAMHELGEADREAVVLRFFQDRSLREIGAALGLSENAARMRVDRALEKLRQLLGRRGVTSTSSSLAAALSVGALLQAPQAFAATVASTVLTTAITSTAFPTLTTLKIMSMTKLKTAAVGTLLLAGVAVPVWQESRVRELSVENAQLRMQSERVSPLKTEAARQSQAPSDADALARLRSEQEQLKLELARTRNMAGVARRAEAEAAQLRLEVAKLQASTGTNQGNPMGDLMRSALDQQAKSKVARMAAKLNLTPAQVEAVQGILDRQSQQMSKAMQSAFSGKLNREELTKMQAGAVNPEQAIQALLSPEQQELYKEYKQEENVAQARLAANTELLQLQGTLGLSLEQQDQAFSVLYDQTLRQMNGEVGGAAKAASPAEAMQLLLEEKAKALEAVLTPAQLQTYRQQQESQIRFLKDFLPQTAGKTGGTSVELGKAANE